MGAFKNFKKGIGALGALGLIDSISKGGLKPKKTTQDQVPLETDEQRQARQKLAQFFNTGQFGDFRAGQDIGLELGDFNPTQSETQGVGVVNDLLGTVPEQYRLGDDALRDLLQTSPAAIESQFSPFRDQVNRQLRESTDALKRNSAFARNLYSTNTVERLGDVQARGNETLASELARLTDQALNRRAAAIPLAYNAAQRKLDDAFQYGSRIRDLNNERIQARDRELLRRREELQLPINTASTIMNSNVNFGVPSVTTSTPSTLMQLLQTLGPAAASAFGVSRGAR